MDKYYIEISCYDDPCDYIMQSQWFDDENKAIEWAKKISFLDKNYEICLMRSAWDFENEIYIDIECVRRIDKELGL